MQTTMFLTDETAGKLFEEHENSQTRFFHSTILKLGRLLSAHLINGGVFLVRDFENTSWRLSMIWNLLCRFDAVSAFPLQ